MYNIHVTYVIVMQYKVNNKIIQEKFNTCGAHDHIE